MPAPGYTKRRFRIGSIVLLLAIAAIGLSAGREAAAQLTDPQRLLDLLKKKKTDAVKEDAAKKKPPIPFIAKKPDGAKTAITPKDLTGKNVIGRATDSKTAVGKATDAKGVTSAIGKTVDGKGGKALLGKATDGKSASIGKGADIKGTNTKGLLGKGLDTKGPLPKGGLANVPKGGLANVTKAATSAERLRLRVDHRRELFTARLRLPVRPLPGQPGFTGVPPRGETRYISTEMMFRIGPNVSPQALEIATRRLGLTTIGSQNIGLAGGTLYHFRVAGGRPVPDVIRALEAQNLGIASANFIFRLTQDADLAAQTDSGGSGQYVVNKLQLGEVHKIATGNNVLVAVIDSAIDLGHPDLAGAIVEEYDAVGQREKPHFHGTGMAGAIAAHRKLLGIAPSAKILAVHAFSSAAKQSPEATTRQILAGLEWAIGKGARIVNMSFAGPYDPLLQLAMKNARDKGVVLIAAAGNLGPKSAPLYPAADPNVIAVTATDENDRLFAQAVRGPHLAVAAPGVDVMVPAPEEAYALTTGTSVAAAHVSGVAALLIERQPSVDAATVLEVLTSTARKLDPKGRDDLFGWGLIDPAAALAELDSRVADSKVAAASRPVAPKQAMPKQTTQKQGAPRLAPASAQ
jgi:Subtilase family